MAQFYHNNFKNKTKIIINRKKGLFSYSLPIQRNTIHKNYKNSKIRKKCMFYLLLKLLGVILFLRVICCRENSQKSEKPNKQNERTTHTLARVFCMGYFLLVFGAIPDLGLGIA